MSDNLVEVDIEQLQRGYGIISRRNRFSWSLNTSLNASLHPIKSNKIK